MKNFFVQILFLFLLISFQFSYGQIFIENFDYPVGDSLTQHGWANHSGTGMIITIAAGSLTYSGYPSSGIGNHVVVEGGSGSREDVNKTFSGVTSGAVYAAFLVSFNVASTDSDYFFHFGQNPMTTTFRGKVWIKDDGAGGFKFGLSKVSNTVLSFTTSSYSYGQTYLLILKNEYVGDPTGSDDILKLYINPDLTGGEPVVPDLQNIDSGTDITVGAVALRQGAIAYSTQIDGIRVSTIWNDLVPVELTSFTATANGNDAILKWTTATELNNSGFEVQRLESVNEFVTIGFISGSGTTTESRNYSYVDRDLNSGTYTYRLKQIDLDGTFTYSDEVNVDITNPVEFELSQNYPNPFNPSTTIKFALPQSSDVTLKVYNTLGQEVKTLVNQFMEAGSHSVSFEAINLNSGIYFYKIEAAEFTDVRKMTLIK